jgi:GTPase
MPRAGIVTLAGKPNAGKSTLLNRLIGQRLSITSPKPQSTRVRVVGILTLGTQSGQDATSSDEGSAGGGAPADPASPDNVPEQAAQLVFFDTPGLLDARDALQRSMRATALQALADADVIVYLADVTAGDPPPLIEAARLTAAPRAPVILAMNKIDALDPARRATLASTFGSAVGANSAGTSATHAEAFLISAATGEGVGPLLDAITARLPESPFLYPDDDISTQSLRFFTTELIRESALEQLHQEIPYSVAAEIEEFREDRTPVYIRAVIYVERDSQKGILLGHKGSRIRELGRSARLKIEQLVSAPVYLDLRVKVLPNWRRDPDALRRLGFHPAPVR